MQPSQGLKGTRGASTPLAVQPSGNPTQVVELDIDEAGLQLEKMDLVKPEGKKLLTCMCECVYDMYVCVYDM